MPLTSKLTVEQAFDGPRQRIYDRICRQPGLCFTELQKQTLLATGQLSYHLWVLADFGLVEGVKAGRYRRYYAVGSVKLPEAAADALARNPDSGRVLTAVHTHPGLRQTQLAAAVGGVTRQTVAYHLERLENHGLVARVRDGKGHRWFASATGP